MTEITDLMLVLNNKIEFTHLITNTKKENRVFHYFLRRCNSL